VTPDSLSCAPLGSCISTTRAEPSGWESVGRISAALGKGVERASRRRQERAEARLIKLPFLRVMPKRVAIARRRVCACAVRYPPLAGPSPRCCGGLAERYLAPVRLGMPRGAVMPWRYAAPRCYRWKVSSLCSPSMWSRTEFLCRFSMPLNLPSSPLTIFWALSYRHFSPAVSIRQRKAGGAICYAGHFPQPWAPEMRSFHAPSGALH